MWQCSNCRELVDETLDACWRCGCSRVGGLNTGFLRDLEPEQPSDEMGARFTEQFKCSKCGRDEPVIEVVTGRGAGLKIMLAKDFLAVSCERCGFTEFYNLSILEKRTGMQNFLRQLFRS